MVLRDMNVVEVVTELLLGGCTNGIIVELVLQAVAPAKAEWWAGNICYLGHPWR